MIYLRTAILILFGFYWNLAAAQPDGGDQGVSPEELDAAFTAEDAAREAALWSDEIIDRSAPDPLTTMTAGADVVFHGTVVAQSVVYDGNDVPFTRTTFAVDKVLKGELEGSEFSLLQEGGTSRTDANAFMTSSTSQYFALGDEEVLFVQLRSGSVSEAAGGRPAIDDGDRSLRSAAQLVEHRLRVYGGQVYDEDGRGLIIGAAEDGGIRMGLSGDRHPAARFNEIPIGAHKLGKKFGGGSGNQSGRDASPEGSAERAAAPSYADGADIDTLIAAITAVSE